MWSYSAAFLNQWAVISSLKGEWLFHMGHLKPLENTDIYIMIHNSSKITVINSNKNNFMVGGHHSMGSCIKGPWH